MEQENFDRYVNSMKAIVSLELIGFEEKSRKPENHSIQKNLEELANSYIKGINDSIETLAEFKHLKYKHIKIKNYTILK